MTSPRYLGGCRGQRTGRSSPSAVGAQKIPPDPETATGPVQAGCPNGIPPPPPQLLHPSTGGGSARRPCRGRGGGHGGPGCSALPGGAPRRSRSPPARGSAPRPGQRLPGAGGPGAASLFFLPRCRGGSPWLWSPIGPQGGATSLPPPPPIPGYWPWPPGPPGSLLPPPGTQAASVRGWLSRKGRTPFIPWDFKKNKK